MRAPYVHAYSASLPAKLQEENFNRVTTSIDLIAQRRRSQRCATISPGRKIFYTIILGRFTKIASARCGWEPITASFATPASRKEAQTKSIFFTIRKICAASTMIWFMPFPKIDATHFGSERIAALLASIVNLPRSLARGVSALA